MKTTVVDTTKLEWRASPYEGVQWKKLTFDKETGLSTVLLRFEPGASYGAHRHPKGEQYFVLDGSLEEGGKTYGAGTYVRYFPGSAHQPSSREGCTLLVTLPKPVEMIGE